MKKTNCILLVDDNPADNEFHKIAIRKGGICNHIKVVTSGDEALSYIIKSVEQDQSESFPKPDIIFLDINMPRMNGFEFLDEYIKLDKQLKSKVVIMMLTTSLNPNDEKRARAYECINGFLNKPLTVAMLQETLEEYF